MLDGISHAFETFWSDKLHVHFILSSWHSRERTFLREHRKKLIGSIQTNFSQIAWHLWTLKFDTSLNDLDLHSVSQLYCKMTTSVLIFWQISQRTWVKCSKLPGPVDLSKCITNFFLHAVSIQGRESYLDDCINLKWACMWMLINQFCSNLIPLQTWLNLQFVNSLNDPDFHSRS